MKPQSGGVNPATMPLGWRHIWIVFVASLGQMVGTGVATLAGVLIPMYNIATRPELSSVMQGLVGAADLTGIVIGSVLFGRLTDRYGYILFFRLCPAVVLVASVVAALVPSVWVLVICLFIVGIGIGGEYSLDSDYISELMPVRWRPLMVGVAKTGSAFGNIIVAGVCWLLVLDWDNASRWPDLMWIVAAIALLMIICRIWFWQSPGWLMLHGRTAQAERDVRRFLGPDVTLPVNGPDSSVKKGADGSSSGNGWDFVRANWRKIMLSGVPWACEGLGVYGIGVFLPILVIALGLESASSGADPVLHVADSVRVTFLISCIILPGFLIGLWMISRKCDVARLQIKGFWGCAVSLAVLLAAYHFHWPPWISIVSFMAFELFLNMGPHLITYVLPPKIYPVKVRGLGTGIAASMGKVGAVLAVFVIPVLLKWGGPVLVLAVSAAVMAIGALVTGAYAPRVFKEP